MIAAVRRPRSVCRSADRRRWRRRLGLRPLPARVGLLGAPRCDPRHRPRIVDHGDLRSAVQGHGSCDRAPGRRAQPVSPPSGVRADDHRHRVAPGCAVMKLVLDDRTYADFADDARADPQPAIDRPNNHRIPGRASRAAGLARRDGCNDRPRPREQPSHILRFWCRRAAADDRDDRDPRHHRSRAP